MARGKTKAPAVIERPPSGTTETIVWRPMEDLRAFERNSRTHTAEQIGRIRQSFREFGWMQPILVQEDGTIVAGHARVEAAKLEGWDVAKCLDVSGLSPEQVRAYVIADNRLALDAGWDEEMLKLEFEELEAAGFDTTAALGFSATEIDQLVNGLSDTSREWNGMPEFDQQNKEAFRSIVIHFKDQASVDAFAELIAQKITPKTRMAWFPNIEIERYVDKEYVREA